MVSDSYVLLHKSITWQQACRAALCHHISQTSSFASVLFPKDSTTVHPTVGERIKTLKIIWNQVSTKTSTSCLKQPGWETNWGPQARSFPSHHTGLKRRFLHLHGARRCNPSPLNATAVFCQSLSFLWFHGGWDECFQISSALLTASHLTPTGRDSCRRQDIIPWKRVTSRRNFTARLCLSFRGAICVSGETVQSKVSV